MPVPPGYARRGTGAIATGTTSLTVALPAGVVNGDLLLLSLSHRGAGFATVPAGWTAVGQGLAASGVRGELYWKWAASEGASISVTGLATAAAGSIAAYSGGAGTGNPIDATLTVLIPAASIFTANAEIGPLTTIQPQDLFVAFCAVGQASTIISSSSFVCGDPRTEGYLVPDPDLALLSGVSKGGASQASFALSDGIKIVPGSTIGSIFVQMASTNVPAAVAILVAFVPATGANTNTTTHYYLTGRPPTTFLAEPWNLAGAWLSTLESGPEEQQITNPTLLSQIKVGGGALQGRGPSFSSPYASNLQGNADLLVGRFMTPPLQAQTLSCTLDVCLAWLVRWLSSSGYTTQSTANLKLHVYTTVGQSTTVRLTLLNNYVDATALSKTSWVFAGLTTPQALAGSIQAGDSLVVELGVRIVSSPTPAPTYPPTEWTEIDAVARGTASGVPGQDAVRAAVVSTGSLALVPYLILSQVILEQAPSAGPVNVTPATATIIGSVPYQEPRYDTSQAASNGRSVWYSWTPTRTGVALLSAFGSQGCLVPQVYTGGPDYATLVSADPYVSASATNILRARGSCQVAVTAGTPYLIRLYSFAADQFPSSAGGLWRLGVTYRELPQIDDLYLPSEFLCVWRDGQLVNLTDDLSAFTPSGIAIDYTHRPMADLNGGISTGDRVYLALFGGGTVEILDIATLNNGEAEIDFISDPLELVANSGIFTPNLAALQLTTDGFLYVQTFGDGFLRVCGIAAGIPAEASALSDTAAKGAIRGLDATHADNQAGAPFPIGSLLDAPAQLTGPWAGTLIAPNSAVLAYTSGGVYSSVTSDGATQIRQYDLVAQGALSNLATLTTAGTNKGLKGVCRVPASGGSGYLVCNGDRIHRLDSTGAIVQTYVPQTAYTPTLIDVKVTADGTKFWALDLATTDLFQFDLASGVQLQYVQTFQGGYGNAIQFALYQPPQPPPPTPPCLPLVAADLLSLGPGVPPSVAPPAQQTLVLDLKALRWFPDQYASPVTVRLAEPGAGVHNQVLGGIDGTVAVFGGASDQGAAIPYGFRTPDFTGGDTRREKTFGDLILDCDPAGGAGFSLQAAGNNFSEPAGGAIPAVPGSPAGRQTFVIDLNGGLGYIGRSLGLAIVGADTVAPTWYLWEPAFVPKVEDTLRRATDWDDSGYFGAKFVQGVIIEADTLCATRLLQVEYDDGQFTEIFPVTTDGIQGVVAYSFQQPFATHLTRLVLLDQTFWRYYRHRIVYEPMPEAVSVWETQPTTLDLPGYSQEERVLIAHMSTVDFDLSITADGRTLTYRVPNSGGQFVKTEVLEAPNKGKVYQYRFATVDGSSSLRLFLKDCECRHRAWGGDGYQVVRPFGDLSRENGGARI